jgi:hypothetical protein
MSDWTRRKDNTMKRASYRHGIKWIALNDEPECLDPHSVSYQISSMLLCDLFDVDCGRVGHDIVRYRKQAIKRSQKEK